MAHEFDNISVVEINGGDEEGADVALAYNDKRIIVSVFASPSSHGGDHSLPESLLENRIIRLLNEAIIAAREDYEDLIDEALDAILEVGGSSFSQATLRIHDLPPATQDLQSLLYPEALYYRLQTIDGKATIFQISPDEGHSLPDNTPEPRLDSVFQPDEELFYYLAKDILVQEIFLEGNGTVSRVHVDGQDMLCKAQRAGLWDVGLERELANFQKIRESTTRTGVTIRVPCLHGYVIHEKSRAPIGLLREWIPSGAYGKTLRDVNVLVVPLDIRQKWADQIQQAVADLHCIGVIWGDGKPSNIIIDQSDDIWLIDFAGGWSQGWVDEQLAETVEGDDQAVGRIGQFLGL